MQLAGYIQSTVLYKAVKELKNSSTSTATIFISSLMLIVSPSFLAEFHQIAVVLELGV